MWVKIAGILLRNRVAFIIGVLIITILLGFQIRKLEMSYEYANLIPATDSAFIEYTNFLDKFGQEGNVMVFALQDSNFFELKKVNDWIRMCDSIKRVPGVVALVDVTNSYNLIKDTTLKRFDIEPIFNGVIEEQTQLDSLVEIVQKLTLYDGTLFNKKDHIYGMMLTVSAEVMASPKRVGLVKQVVDITENFNEKYNLKMHYSGMPYIRVVNAESLKTEMYLFIVLSLLITACILYLFFRSFRILSFCLFIVMICVIWTVGVMAMLGIKISILTAMLPPLLIVICVPNLVFMINKFHSEYDHHNNKVKALQRMIQKVGNASFMSNLTTAAGFGTFIFTSSQILVEFGLVASIGIAFVYFVCLIMIPSVFTFLQPPDSKQIRHLHNRTMKSVLDRVIKVVLNRREIVYLTVASLIVLSIIGFMRIKTTGYMVDDLKESDPIRQDLTFFEESFDGLMPLEVAVDLGKPREVMNLANLEKLDHFSKDVSEDEDISKPVSIVEVVKFANQAFYNGNPKYYKLPTNQTKNFIFKYIAESTAGVSSMSNSFVDSTLQSVRLSFRVKDIGTNGMEAKEKKIHDIGEKYFPSDRYKVTVTGSSIINFKGNQYLIKNLFTSLALAIILIAVFMAWMFKSKRMVLVALVPNVIPLFATAAIMGFFNIPLKASTILVFSISFGISVDGTIHYLAKYRQELQATGWMIRISVIRALQEIGQSMIYNAIILFFGFGVFALSDFGGTVALGLLVSITLLAAMFSNVIILPALLLTLDKYTTNRDFKKPALLIYENEGVEE